MDKRATALSMIQMAWPRFTTAQGVFYDKQLEDIPDELLFSAIDALTKESPFLPSIAEIRDRARSLYKSAAGLPEPDAGKAWGEVVKAISHVGMNRFPEFSDSRTAETVRRMGWKDICLAPVDSTSTLRAQFLRMYREVAEREETTRKNNVALSDGSVKDLILNIANHKRLK